MSPSCQSSSPHDSPSALRRETASRAGDGLRLGVDAAEELALVVRELVERTEGDVEARVGVVDREHVDRRAVVRELPARAALGRAPAADRGRAADVGEARERPEGREACARKVCQTRRGARGGVRRDAPLDSMPFGPSEHATVCRSPLALS